MDESAVSSGLSGDAADQEGPVMQQQPLNTISSVQAAGDRLTSQGAAGPSTSNRCFSFVLQLCPARQDITQCPAPARSALHVCYKQLHLLYQASHQPFKLCPDFLHTQSARSNAAWMQATPSAATEELRHTVSA